MSKIVWRPSTSQIKKTQMLRFLQHVNQTCQLTLTNYAELYHWSINNKAQFWHTFWHFCNFKIHKEPDKIFVPGKAIQDSRWFIGAELNFAENLLSRRDGHIALISISENKERHVYTYAQLYDAVAKLAAFLRENGIRQNDRIAAVLPNIPEAVIGMLATTSFGAIWSSCSPDFGCAGLFDRFAQITPKVLIICESYFYNGKRFSITEKIQWLEEKIPSLEKIIIVNAASITLSSKMHKLENILARPATELTFASLPFDHPVYIMYSSGTTGAPKCIVHGAGGTLLQHMKELVLHTNLHAHDIIFYYTTCGWMMWNWYISSLAAGASIVQYSGAPFYPNACYLFDLVDDEKITILGVSAKYLSMVEKNELHLNTSQHLQSLHTILSTGSPLTAPQFDFVYTHLKSDVQLSSISGGTDIISCFALGNPMLPVYAGELQCIGLGMEVKIYTKTSKAVVNQKGELVCTAAFPSMPIYFWNDPDGRKYQQAYFTQFPGVWAQGDFAEITERETVIIYGRSDATLNPGGVRIGTAEIYKQVEQLREIVESLAVDQEWEGDNRIILFVVLKAPHALTQELENKIRTMLRNNCSPRHVPAKIIAVPDIPKTLSGKIVELAVRNIIHHRAVNNISAIANPESLEFFYSLHYLLV